MAWRSGGPHADFAPSSDDRAASLGYGGILRLKPWVTRDVFVMSRDPGAMARIGLG
jgi:hypothetical protein